MKGKLEPAKFEASLFWPLGRGERADEQCAPRCLFRRAHGAIAARAAASRQMAHLRQSPDRYRGTRCLRSSAVPAWCLVATAGTKRRALGSAHDRHPARLPGHHRLRDQHGGLGARSGRQSHSAGPGAVERVGQHVRRGLLLALQRAVARWRSRTRRKSDGSRADPHRLHDAHRRGDRVLADEAVGSPVDGRHLLDGRGDLDQPMCST